MVAPEQMAEGFRVLLRVGVGLTTTVTLCVLEQELAVVTNEYTTLTGAVVVLTKTSLGLEDWATVTAAFEMPTTAARVQVKVAPVVVDDGV